HDALPILLVLASRRSGSGVTASQPGRELPSYHWVFGTRGVIQPLPSSTVSNSSRQVKLPVIGAWSAGFFMKDGPGSTYGIFSPCGRITGQPSFQVTGSRNASRPVL